MPSASSAKTCTVPSAIRCRTVYVPSAPLVAVMTRYGSLDAETFIAAPAAGTPRLVVTVPVTVVAGGKARSTIVVDSCAK